MNTTNETHHTGDGRSKPLLSRRSFMALTAAGLSLAIAGCSKGSEDSLIDSTEGSGSDAEEFSLSVEALDDVDDAFGSFSLSGAETPAIPNDELSRIEAALDAVEESASAGFMLYDLDSGLGVAYNIDEAIYGASSFKAPYALYLCEDVEENGLAELSESDLSLIEASILYSDNSAYVSLRDKYDALDFDAWVTSLHADDAVYRSDSHYPWYCARSSAKLWTEMRLYLQSGTEKAQWLEDLLNRTETSFFRLALSGEVDATFWSKAGWCAGSTDIYNSICEAGLVEADGHTYLLSVMTGLYYSDEKINLFYELVQAVFATRTSLASVNQS